MTDYKRGAEAGIKAGIVQGIISIIFVLILVVFFWREILESSGYNLSNIAESDFLNAVGDITPILVISGIIGGIIFGLIIGLIYAGIYKSIPGSTSIRKAWVLSIVGWSVFTLLPNNNTFNISIRFFIIGSVIFGLINWLIYGYLLGMFWNKYEEKRHQRNIIL